PSPIGASTCAALFSSSAPYFTKAPPPFTPALRTASLCLFGGRLLHIKILAPSASCHPLLPSSAPRQSKAPLPFPPAPRNASPRSFGRRLSPFIRVDRVSYLPPPLASVGASSPLRDALIAPSVLLVAILLLGADLVSEAPPFAPTSSFRSSSLVEKGMLVDWAVYRKAKWRLAEAIDDAEDDKSGTQAELLSEGDMSSVELEPATGNFRATDDLDYCLLLWREKPEREQKHHILRAPPVDLKRKGERAPRWESSTIMVKMTKKASGTSGVGSRNAPSASAGRVPSPPDRALTAPEDASSPQLFLPLNPRDPLPEKASGKRPASAGSPADVPKKKKKPALGGIDEILAPPRSRRAVKPKELVPISPSAALNAPSAFTSAVELKNFLKLPLDEGTSPAGSACQHLFQAMLDVIALSDKGTENRERAHKNYLLASQLKTDKTTLQDVNSRLGEELALVKQQLSDALAADSVSAREEKEKELALRAKRIDDLEKELQTMSAARGRQRSSRKSWPRSVMTLWMPICRQQSSAIGSEIF
ncbi:unnamed protein product, partial [Linum tenue]